LNGAQLGVDAARCQALLDRGRVQLLRDRQDADQLVSALARFDADDRHDMDLVRARDDVRAERHWQLQVAAIRKMK